MVSKVQKFRKYDQETISKILKEYEEDVLYMINILIEDNKQRQALFEEIL